MVVVALPFAHAVSLDANLSVSGAEARLLQSCQHWNKQIRKNIYFNEEDSAKRVSFSRWGPGCSAPGSSWVLAFLGPQGRPIPEG